MPNCDDGHSKRLWMANGMAERPVPQEELYDLMFDPQERHNLAGDSLHEEILKDLKRELNQWMRDTDDPLLHADPSVMPLPQMVNTHDQLHPGKDAIQWDPTEWPV